MSPKAKRLGMLSLVSLLVFFASFFGFIEVNSFISGFFSFLFLLFWAVTDTPKQMRLRYKGLIISFGCIVALAFGFFDNRYESLSWIILYGGIIFGLWDLYRSKTGNMSYKIRDYSMNGLFSMVYFIGFATAAHLVSSTNTLNLNCDDIYNKYQQVTSVLNRSSITAEPQNSQVWYDVALSKASSFSESYPGLHYVLSTLKSYQQEISISISDQQQINREICSLVTQRIHDMYDHGDIKAGLVVLIGLFLYPFFIILFYFYGFLTYLLMLIALRYKLFNYKKVTVEKTELE